jgi:glycerol-3-phosphate dehydrogenase
MSAERCEVVVVGGGIHGAGVAQAVAAAGHEVLLLEKDEVAHGTSSRSSKLIHGGLRYLETAQFGLVHESLRERGILLRIAPGLVHLVPFHVPVYRETSRRPWQIRIGLGLYALLGGLRADARFERVPRARWPALDGLRTDGLQSVFRYHDAQTDDAGLTRAVVRSARELGVRVLCPARFVSARREPAGYRVVYEHDGAEHATSCLVLVNAAGPWANGILGAVTPRPPSRAVDLVQGTHIIVGGTMREGVYYAEAPRDRRAVFIMPWGEATLVGTTETRFEGDPDAVRPLPAEIDYLRETLRHYFPAHPGEVVDAFAGLRVLPRGPTPAFSRPRALSLWPDDRREPRLVTLYGGKLTAYRSSAVKVVAMLRRVLPARTAIADTASLRLPAEGDR